MKTARGLLLDWAERGAIDPARLREAMARAGVFPTPVQWHRFVALLLLWLGTGLLAAGVIFFLAYNWDELGRFGKFALAEAVVAAALVAIWRFGLERLPGQAALVGAALAVGALLALIGQAYQTGADTFELFAAWSALIVPWVFVGRLPVLWILWVGLLNLAVATWFSVMGGLLGLVFGPEPLSWTLFALNTTALLAWELAARAGVRWLEARWATRLLATASGVSITMLALWSVFAGTRDAHIAALPVWLAWIGTAWFVYRRLSVDLYVLAGGVLSVVVVVTALLARALIETTQDPGVFLLVAILVLGMSAGGGWWLKTVAREGR